MKKILFLQPERYFKRLGVNTTKINSLCVFGLPVINRDIVGKLRSYDLIVSCIDHSGLNQLINFLCDEYNIHTLFLMDGVFDYENSVSNPYLTRINKKLFAKTKYDSIAALDTSLENYFQGVAKTVNYYWPQHVVPITMRKKQHSQKGSVLEVSTEAKKQKDETVDFLITTANAPYFNKYEFKLLQKTINHIATNLENLGLSYCFRIFDKKLIESLNLREDNNLLTDSLDEVISKSKAVFSTQSSVIYTAILMGKPVCILNYRDAPITSNAGWLYHLGLPIEKTIKSMLKKDKSRLDFQESLIGNHEDVNKIIYKKACSEKKTINAEGRVLMVQLDTIIYKALALKKYRVFKWLFSLLK